MQKVKRPVLRYHGGKFLLAQWIISHFPKHRTYVECFGGGGSVLMRKPRSYAEVYNDKWDTVVNVFKVLRDAKTAYELERQIRLTPFSRTEFEKCGNIEINETTDPIEKARLTIFRSFAGFGSASTNAKHATGFRANSNKSGTTPAHDWVNYPDHITSFVERLKGVVIENRDYREVIAQQDSPETLIYLDPPYVHSTRNMQRGSAAYAFEMTEQDHIDMANALEGIKGMAVISGYDNDLYRDLFRGWLKIERKAFADGAVKELKAFGLMKMHLIKSMYNYFNTMKLYLYALALTLILLFLADTKITLWPVLDQLCPWLAGAGVNTDHVRLYMPESAVV